MIRCDDCGGLQNDGQCPRIDDAVLHTDGGLGKDHFKSPLPARGQQVHRTSTVKVF
jgi:hypothetical protein